MKRILVIGETLSGKSALIRALSGTDYSSQKSMSVEYFGQFINTPGEFLENRRFYRALITASADSALLFFVQDATRKSCLLPPQFAKAFAKKSYGIITKIDDAHANIPRAERFLHTAGVAEILCVSAHTGEGLEAVRAVYTE